MSHPHSIGLLPRLWPRLCLWSVAAGCGPAESGPPPADTQGFVCLAQPSGAMAREARGVWRTRGYGYRLVIGERSAELFSETGSFVVRMPPVAPEFLHEAFVREGDEADTLLLTDHPGSTWRVLERTEPAATVRELNGDWTPEERFLLFAETVGENFAFFELWGVDWEQRVAEQRGRVGPATTDAELFEVYAQMLEGIDDAHFGLKTVIDGEPRSLEFGKGPTKRRIRELFEQSGAEGDLNTYFNAWYQDYLRGIDVQVLRNAGHSHADSRLRWGWLDERVGYLHVPRLAGFPGEGLRGEIETFDSGLDAALTDLQDAAALVLDLSYCQGGHDAFGRAVAGRFADRERLAFVKLPVQDGDVEQRFHAVPTSRVRFEGPVFVVTSDITMSAAETLVLYLRSLPQVTLVGQPTRGALSDVLEKPLPHDTLLMLSNEVYVDPEGVCHERRGIPVDVPLVVFDPVDPRNGHVQAIAAARELAAEAARDR